MTGTRCIRPNITGAVAFHTYSGVLLRPYSHLADDQIPPEDLWTFQKIGNKGTQIKKLGEVSRKKIESFVGSKIYLDLWVKVLANWRKNPGSLSRFGYQLATGNQK